MVLPCRAMAYSVAGELLRWGWSHPPPSLAPAFVTVFPRSETIASITAQVNELTSQGDWSALDQLEACAQRFYINLRFIE